MVRCELFTVYVLSFFLYRLNVIIIELFINGMTIWIRIARDLVRNHLVQICVYRYLADIPEYWTYICKLIFGTSMFSAKTSFCPLGLND